MDILNYFKEVNAQKQINKLAKKYKNKRIVLYGAGEYFKILSENYDLSRLNIVGICDKKFEATKENNPSKFFALEPNELKTFDYDVILSVLYDDTSLLKFLEYKLLLNTKNENCEIASLIEPTLKYIIKLFLWENL